MSGKQAKAARRAIDGARLDAFEEALLQIHDQLHQDEPDLAVIHGLVHQAFGVDDAEVIEVAPLAAMGRFDTRFRQLLRTEGVIATYIALDPASHTGRMISGGASKLTERIDYVMRRGLDAVNADNQRAVQLAHDVLDNRGAAAAIAAEFAAGG